MTVPEPVIAVACIRGPANPMPCAAWVVKPPFLPYSPHIPVVTFLSLYHFLSPQKKLNKNQKMPSHIFGGVHKLLRANIGFPSFPFFGFVHVHSFFEKSLLFMLIKKVGNHGKISQCIVRAHQPSLVSTFCCVDWLIFYLQHHSPVWYIYYCRWIIVCGACFISLSFFAALTYIYD